MGPIGLLLEDQNNDLKDSVVADLGVRCGEELKLLGSLVELERDHLVGLNRQDLLDAVKGDSVGNVLDVEGESPELEPSGVGQHAGDTGSHSHRD